MYCPTHDRYFHKGQICFACLSNLKEKLWVEGEEPTQEDKLLFEIAALKTEKISLDKGVKHLTKSLKTSLDAEEEAKKLLAWQKTKTDAIEQGYRDALDREEVLRGKLRRRNNRLDILSALLARF